MTTLAARWLRTVPSLREVSLRVAYLRVELQQRPVAELAPALDTVCLLAAQAAPRAREVLGVMAIVLADPAFEKRVGALSRVADEDGLVELGRLLRAKPLMVAPSDAASSAIEHVVSLARDGRVLTLGERRALARRPTRAAFSKLVLDPHPMVIRLLLNNPRLTEDDVVGIASRRSSAPDVIAEVAQHPGFSQRPRVRRAILQNPTTPPEVSLRLLPLVLRTDLASIAASPDLTPVVRAAARELLQRTFSGMRAVDGATVH
jgi:hypothetical protein